MTSTDVSPVSGQVVNPTAVSQAASFPAHDFFGVIKKLVHSAGFHNQADVENALNAINAYEQHVISPSDRRMVVQEGDPAPLEDVTQRRPASAPAAVIAQSPGQIDYAKLAAAIVAAQSQQTGEEPSA